MVADKDKQARRPSSEYLQWLAQEEQQRVAVRRQERKWFLLCIAGEILVLVFPRLRPILGKLLILVLHLGTLFWGGACLAGWWQDRQEGRTLSGKGRKV